MRPWRSPGVNRVELAVFAAGVGALALAFAGGALVALRDWHRVPWASLNHMSVVGDLRAAGDLDRAIFELAAEQRINTSDVRSGLKLASLLSETGNPGSVDVLRLASENSLDARVHLRYAAKLAQLGRFDEVEVAVRRAEAFSTGSPDLWLIVGDMYDKVYRPEEATAAYARALEIDPDSVHARRALQRLGDGAPAPGEEVR